jgi:phosphonopyruvate decarboxylase
MERITNLIQETQKPFAILVRKNSFSKYTFEPESIKYNLKREKCIEIILDNLKEDDIIVSTTGKTSRELNEVSKNKNLKNPMFYTIGGMGHSSQIALGISNFSSKRVICFDGDGSIIMHMGSMGIIGNNSNENYFHILFNNGTHESVGGQPTIGKNINFGLLSKSLGYNKYIKLTTKEKILNYFKNITNLIKGPVFIEILIDSSSRSDLGRPEKTPIEQKKYLKKKLND